ncbi:hypothetical protein PIB30_108619, partial [Stylosanthes scabra]|nr:hypothetical protein [Stylosanthes scabra]
MGHGRLVPWCTTTRSGERPEPEGGLCDSHGMVTGEAAAHSRRCQRAHPSPRILHARQVGQPSTLAMAPFVEGFCCMCALVVGQRRPSLDVSVAVQCGERRTTDIAGCVPLILSWIYHRFLGLAACVLDVDAWPLAERLIGYQQPGRDQQEGRLLHWRSRLDSVTLDE